MRSGQHGKRINCLISHVACDVSSTNSEDLSELDENRIEFFFEFFA